MNASLSSGVRIDAWAWAVRLYPSRSAATAACRSGHLKLNGKTVKPAQTVHLGDSVRALTPGGERLLVVTGLLVKRVGAAVAAEHYDDLTPPPPPREERPATVLRDRGAGRPTKRDRRLIERLRGRDPVEPPG